MRLTAAQPLKVIYVDRVKSCEDVKYCFNVTAYWSNATTVNCSPPSYWRKLKSIVFKQFNVLEDPEIFTPLGEF